MLHGENIYHLQIRRLFLSSNSYCTTSWYFQRTVYTTWRQSSTSHAMDIPFSRCIHNVAWRRAIVSQAQNCTLERTIHTIQSTASCRPDNTTGNEPTNSLIERQSSNFFWNHGILRQRLLTYFPNPLEYDIEMLLNPRDRVSNIWQDPPNEQEYWMEQEGQQGHSEYGHDLLT